MTKDCPLKLPEVTSFRENSKLRTCGEHGRTLGEHWEEHVDYISCSKCQNRNRQKIVCITCSSHVLPMELGIFMY